MQQILKSLKIIESTFFFTQNLTLVFLLTFNSVKKRLNFLFSTLKTKDKIAEKSCKFNIHGSVHRSTNQ
jgi:hypothetical protein